jgi:hypothetical protein
MAHALRCRCGHDVETHEHFRGGSDCGACIGCHRFIPADPMVLGGVAWNRLRSAEPVLSRPPRTPAR